MVDLASLNSVVCDNGTGFVKVSVIGLVGVEKEGEG
jgi:hypothetical protein